jgi:hypothetical protein
MVGLDGEGAFKLRTRVKFNDRWCVKAWSNWHREVRLYSNASTGNQWVANKNE